MRTSSTTLELASAGLLARRLDSGPPIQLDDGHARAIPDGLGTMAIAA